MNLWLDARDGEKLTEIYQCATGISSIDTIGMRWWGCEWRQISTRLGANLLFIFVQLKHWRPFQSSLTYNFLIVSRSVIWNILLLHSGHQVLKSDQLEFKHSRKWNNNMSGPETDPITFPGTFSFGDLELLKMIIWWRKRQGAATICGNRLPTKLTRD